MYAKLLFAIFFFLTLFNLSEALGPAIAIISGQGDDTDITGNPAYAALVDAQGNLAELTGLEPFTEGIINKCGFNGIVGLIGGEDLLNQLPIAAIVSSTGDVQFLNLSFSSNGFIQYVDQNSSGFGIIVGQDNPNRYAAFVSPTGAVTPISALFLPGQLRFTAINESGNAIVGGDIVKSCVSAIEPTPMIFPKLPVL